MKFSYAATLLMMYINCFLCVYSIKCYQCRSDLHASCRYHQTGEFLVNCEDNFKKLDKKVRASLQLASNRSVRTNAFCRKIQQKLLFTSQKSETIIRECAYIHGNTEHCYKSIWPDSRVVTCECSGNGCNKGLSRLKNNHMYSIPILYTILSAILRIPF